MSWTNVIRSSFTVVAVAGGLAGAAGAATIVVRSSGPSMSAYPPGKALADNSRIVLRSSDQIVILDSRGTRTLKGPGTFSPNSTTSQAAESRATFAEVSGRRARPGAVRGMTFGGGQAPRAPQPTLMAKSPNIWFVDIGRSSNACVIDPTRVTLWRPEPGPAAMMTLARVSDGKSATVAWQAGQETQPWPMSMPVTQGAEYRLSWGNAMPATQLKLAVLGPTPTGLEDMASALIRNGCEAQLDLLIETVAIPDKSSPPAG